MVEGDVCEKQLLVAAFERVEPGVSVFFEEMEVGKVVLDAVAVKIPENAQGRFLVNKKKATEVCVELLDAGARGNEIVIGTEIMEFHFHESFLQAHVIVEAVGAAARIRAPEAAPAAVPIVKAN